MKTVIEMAGEVDAVTKVLLDRKEPQGMSHDVFIWFLERFAELIRTDAIVEEREACAKVCDDLDACGWAEAGEYTSGYGDEIRKRNNT